MGPTARTFRFPQTAAGVRDRALSRSWQRRMQAGLRFRSPPRPSVRYWPAPRVENVEDTTSARFLKQDSALPFRSPSKSRVTVKLCRVVGCQPNASLPKELLSESSGSVFAFINAAPLHFRNNEVDKVSETFGRHSISEIKAINIGIANPGNQFVNNLAWRANDDRCHSTDAGEFCYL